MSTLTSALLPTPFACTLRGSAVLSVSPPGDRSPSISDPNLPLLKLSASPAESTRRGGSTAGMNASDLKNSRMKANSADALSSKTRSAERNMASIGALYTWKETHALVFLERCKLCHIRKPCHRLDTLISH